MFSKFQGGSKLVALCIALIALFFFIGLADAATKPCRDRDGDGFFNHNRDNLCGIGILVDCDDRNPAVNPGATEICDGVDNNCDGFVDEGFDSDGDGYTICDGDCDDINPAVNPGVRKEKGCDCFDGIDNECDGLIDSADRDCRNQICDICVPTGLPDTNCDGIDDDCNGIPDDGYVPTPTSCGDGVCAATGQIECQGGTEIDTCTPGPQNEPSDVTCDGLDGDCDGLVDEDYVTTPTTCGDGVCASTGQLECVAGVENDTCTPGPQNEPTDVTCDGLDGDCDGLVDEDYVTTPTTCGDGVCAASGAIECQGGAEVDTCTPGPQNEPSDVTCDGLDGDCDGLVDEDYVTTPTSCGDGVCAATGQLECVAGVENDTCTPGPQNEPTDVTCDGLDGDCDGAVDEDYVITSTTCGVGECASTGQLECVAGVENDTCTPLPAGTEGPEGDPTCDDTLDNDCDGATDLADSDCLCVTTGLPDTNCDGIDDDCNGIPDDGYVPTPTSCGDGVCAASGAIECQGGTEIDTCTPGTPTEATDVTCDGLDGDCDGAVDEDYVTTPTSCGDGVCLAAGTLECQGGTEVDTCTPGPQNEPTDVTCDGLDGDCDGAVDEDYVTTPTSCGDGVCAATGQLECVAGVENNTCTPGPQNEPSDVTCDGLDGDCDGAVDEDYVTTPTSCGDGVCAATGQLECVAGVENDTCTPGPQNEPTDVTCDGLDGDCDGAVDEDYVITSTTCGVGECESTGQLECVAGVENDTCTPLPAGTEGPEGDPTCDDTLDNDCDGATDLADSDCLCVTTGLPDTNCDGIDDDCNGIPDDGYVPTPTSCGDGVCAASGAIECQGGTEIDTCTPGPQNEPSDVTCDGLDGDCDGLVDEDYVTSPTTCGDGVCASTGQLECVAGVENDTCTPGPQNEPTDVTCDGLDGDCDGLVDEDYVTTPTSCGDGVCAAAGQLECVAGVENNTCTPGPQNEPSDVTCDGLDGDCDGAVDEDYVTTPTSCGDGVCAAAGQLECVAGVENDTCTPGPQNEPTDVTCDGLDGDCDGAVDEDYVITSTTCGVGECESTGQLECVAGVENDTCTPLPAGTEGPEGDPTCDDTLDNDCDGATDLADSDCLCVTTGLPDDNCDGIDDDCNGIPDDGYVPTPTTCGDGVCAASGAIECQGGTEIDTCTPGTPTEATDVTCDGLDGDCDGLVDEDYVTSPTTCGDGVCAATGQLECVAGVENDTCTPGPQNEPTDVTCDGLDGDCDGAVDEDYVTTPTSCGDGVCAATGQLECVAGVENDTCTPGPQNEPTDVTCDGLDGDCDGLVDEDYVTTPTSCGDGVCAATGQLECVAGVENNTCTPGPQNEPTDVTCDGLDGDCDGAVDEDYVTSTTNCGVGVCSSTGLLECIGGTELDNCTPNPATEPGTELTCDDMLDNDCDGTYDDPVSNPTNPDSDCPPPGGDTCVECHNGIPSGGSGYVTRNVAGNNVQPVCSETGTPCVTDADCTGGTTDVCWPIGDYVQPSRHVFGGTVTNWDCIVCHREGDAAQAAATPGVVANTAVHQNAQVDMRNVDNINDVTIRECSETGTNCLTDADCTGGTDICLPGTVSLVWDKISATNDMYTALDYFCMSCHDPDGASSINVKVTDDGVHLDATRALTPFNSSDGLSSTGTQGGTAWLPAMPVYERTRVLDIFSKFDPTNPSHHAVRGQAYTSHDADWGSGAWVDKTLNGSGLGLVSSGLFEAATLHCTDCHVENSHGSPNGFRLQATSIDGTCYLCHNGTVYGTSGTNNGSRWNHSNDSSNTFDLFRGSKLGVYDGNLGSVCLNCHGGNIGNGSTFIDGYGGIHGLPYDADLCLNDPEYPDPTNLDCDQRSGEPRYRFQGGSYMSHQPASWTAGPSAGGNTCYFAGGNQDWSSCTQHSGTANNRTPGMNYERGVPGSY